MAVTVAPPTIRVLSEVARAVNTPAMATATRPSRLMTQVSSAEAAPARDHRDPPVTILGLACVKADGSEDNDWKGSPMNRQIQSYDYVNHPYPAVRDALVRDPAAVLRAATNAAASRARAVAAALHVNIGPLDIGTEIAVTVGEISERTSEAPISQVTRIPIEWSAAQRAALFPIMDAELSVYPLTATETQLDFRGRYEPPLGILGGALDAIVGHRIAQASVHRLVADVANYLREHVK